MYRGFILTAGSSPSLGPSLRLSHSVSHHTFCCSINKGKKNILKQKEMDPLPKCCLILHTPAASSFTAALMAR